jgi:beta-phosphoglucomutase family hydrolase
MIKAVIFDMDGVLVDTEPLSDIHMHKHFKKLGLKVPFNYFEQFRGITTPEFWRIIVKKFNLQKSVEELVQETRTSFLNFLSSHKLEPIPGAVEFLENLQKNKIELALASAGSKKRIQTILETCNLKNYFKVVVSADDVIHGKPHPEIYLKTARLLKIAPNDCVVIEDAINGILSAKAAGMKVIGFKTSEMHKQDLSKADKIVKSLSEITIQMLENL